MTDLKEEQDALLFKSWHLFGHLCTELGDVETSLLAYKKCISIDPAQYEPYLALGQLCLGQEAIDLYQKGLAQLAVTKDLVCL